MLTPDSVFVGIDTASSRKAFTYAALDSELRVVGLSEAEMDEMLAFLGAHARATVAINAPSHVNTGQVRRRLESESLTPHAFRGVDIRMAEYELRKRGIAVSGTASREVLCPEWMRVGFSLYEKLSKMGFCPYSDGRDAYQQLETHPHAAFCVLLGRSPLPKPSIEGRLQRQLVLFERNVGIRDPMDFFEEVTRHRLLNGILPLELLHLPEQLDALIAAYTAWVAAQRPHELSRLGDSEEGYLYLPGSELKDKYSS